MQWFIFLIPSAVLIVILTAARLISALGNQSPYELVASAGSTETLIGDGGGLIKVGNKLIFVESYGAKIDKGSRVLIVKYVPEKELYMVEPYV